MGISGANAEWHSKGSQENTFDPESTHAMGVAFDAARWVLGVPSRSAHGAEQVARATVDLAIAGERDPWELRRRVLQLFGY